MKDYNDIQNFSIKNCIVKPELRVNDNRYTAGFLIVSIYIYNCISGPSKEHLLNEVILQHLYRQGQLDISEALAQVSYVVHLTNSLYIGLTLIWVSYGVVVDALCCDGKSETKATLYLVTNAFAICQIIFTQLFLEIP